MIDTRKARLLLCSAVAVPILAFTVSFFGASFGRRLLAARFPAKAQTEQPVAHTLYGGFWRTDGSFVTTLRIENVLVARPLEVTPTLYMADGTPYALPAVEIPQAGVTTIDINQVLAQAPKFVRAHLSDIGSASLSYHYASGGHVNASTLTLDVPHSLTFSYPFMETLDPSAIAASAKASSRMSRMMEPSHHVMEGLWWKRDPGVTGFLTLSNATLSRTIATISMVATGDDSERQGRAVALAPHETRIIPLGELGDRGADWRSDRDEQQQAGGIRVEYDGTMGDILIAGDLVNEREGYSARMPLWERDMSSKPAAQVSYASAGIMVGQPDPMVMTGFPPQTRFVPYLALRNTTAGSMDVQVGVNYMDANGNPMSLQLPQESLRPFEAEQVDLTHELNAAGLAGFQGAINLAVVFTGKAGDLIVATGSVDQAGTYVFEVAPQGVSKTNRKIGSYWSAANGNDTMFSLWNPTKNAEDIAMTFYYGDGSGTYQLPVHLGAEASAMVDVNMLKMQQTPDAQGNTFREDVGEGSVSFGSAKKAAWMTLVSSGGTFNVGAATCGETCIECCGDYASSMVVNPGPLSIEMGGGAEGLELDGENCQGPDDGIPVDTWSSSNSSVATVDADGNVRPAGVGTARITAESSDYTGPDFQLCADGNPQCPDDEPDDDYGDNTTVTPSISSISPAKGPISGTVSVTINGSGLAGATVSAGSGITVTVNSTSDTQIQASFAIGSSASGGNASVTATANGQTSASVNFYVQIPTASRIVNTLASYSINAGNSSICQAGWSGWYRQVEKIVTDQTGADVVFGGQSLTETLTYTRNDFGLGPPTVGGATTDSNGNFDDTFDFCTPACPVTGKEADVTQSISDAPSAGASQTLSPNYLVYTCTGITVNGQ